MAHPDRSIGRGEPDRFASIVQGVFDAEQIRHLGTELSGFRGPFAKEVATWQEEGLGRVVGARNRYMPTGVITGENQHRSMMYALPYTNETVTGFERQVLLVFPSEHSLDVKLVKPKPLFHIDPEVKQTLNESTLSDFDLLFAPHHSPTFLDGWDPDPAKKPVDAFTANLALFPVVLTSEYGTSATTMVNKAVENARRLKRLQHVKEIRVDDTAFLELFDPSAVDALNALTTGFEKWEKGEWD